MIFSRPLMHKRIGYIDLNAAAHWWIEMGYGTDFESFANPTITNAMMDRYHAELKLDWSYGGWLENRKDIWAGTYLRELGLWIHLGLDLNVPAGTTVSAVAAGEIVYEGTDAPLVGGWGQHVIQKIQYRGETHALIYAHLAKRRVHGPLQRPVAKGAVLGHVGSPQENGGWFPHLHLQLFSDIEGVTDWAAFSRDMDGYIQPRERLVGARKCPDPTPLIFR